ncbi:hypothetical protein POM88_013740 [Heracleum sosnowskyi]|uniref:BED-type domain-containing protein n=1 Tax=Heracleum sosnowskyi TaxID=360622 RepID=A0AAD8N306_9APIA|nr:hypothetical protein POM88_013740 [Heracleum sosnowskyi]
MDQFVVPIEIEIEGVTETPPNPTQNITENTTQKTIPNTTPKKKKPVKLKSPKKEGDEPLTNNKKPTRTSNVWEHFTKVKGGDPNNPRCNCNYCGADYACHSTRVGTSSLWVHFRKCKKRVDKKQKVLSFKKETGGGSNLLAVTFNKVRCRTALAKFVVKDEQAFRVVEGDGFKELLQELQPRFVVPSRVTLARDVHHLFCNERAKLMNELTTTRQRVCLTTDCRTSRTQMSYMVLTAHYANTDWKLKKKIINFCLVSNHKGDTIGEAWMVVYRGVKAAK